MTVPAARDHALTRRGFIGAAGGVVVAGTLLAGCGGESEDQKKLDGFLSLSAIVTGFKTSELPRDRAAIFLTALDDSGLKPTASEFLEAAGYLDGEGPKSLAALEDSPAYKAAGGEATARAIAGAWWSGLVTNVKTKDQSVVTYEQALVFKAMPWALPQATCLGELGIWSELAT